MGSNTHYYLSHASRFCVRRASMVGTCFCDASGGTFEKMETRRGEKCEQHQAEGSLGGGSYSYICISSSRLIRCSKSAAHFECLPHRRRGRAGAYVAELIPSGCQHLFGLSRSTALKGPVKMPPQLKHEDHLAAPKSQLRVFMVASSPSAGGGNGTT